MANFSVIPEHNEMGFQCRLTFDKEEDAEPEPPKYTDSCNTYFYVLREWHFVKATADSCNTKLVHIT